MASIGDTNATAEELARRYLADLATELGEWCNSRFGGLQQAAIELGLPRHTFSNAKGRSVSMPLFFTLVERYPDPWLARMRRYLAIRYPVAFEAPDWKAESERVQAAEAKVASIVRGIVEVLGRNSDPEALEAAVQHLLANPPAGQRRTGETA